MPIIEKIRPISGNHSIKEAVISVFLANPLIKPERFGQLIESNFKDFFQQFEHVHQFAFEIRNDPSGIRNFPGPSEVVGFRFLSFEKGARKRVLQGINEQQRSFLSYHSFIYDSWSRFYEDSVKCFQGITELQSDIFINAFSLHYIDEFLWIDPANPIDVGTLFRRDTRYIPSEFFQSSQTTYALVTERVLDAVTKYFDRLEIVVDSKIRPLIRVSHNITQPLKEPKTLKELLQLEDFGRILTLAHTHNKELLKDVLTKDVARLINI